MRIRVWLLVIYFKFLNFSTSGVELLAQICNFLKSLLKILCVYFLNLHHPLSQLIVILLSLWRLDMHTVICLRFRITNLIIRRLLFIFSLSEREECLVDPAKINFELTIFSLEEISFNSIYCAILSDSVQLLNKVEILAYWLLVLLVGWRFRNQFLDLLNVWSTSNCILHQSILLTEPCILKLSLFQNLLQWKHCLLVGRCFNFNRSAFFPQQRILVFEFFSFPL